MFEAQTVGFLDPTSNPRQFVNGYVHLIEQAALGNETARDEYLSLIIPACKAAELPLGYILAVLVILDMALARVISPEFLHWHMAFCYDYTESLIEVWTQS